MNTVDPALALEAVQDVTAVEGLVEELYGSLGSTEVPLGQTLEEFREEVGDSEHTVTVIARRMGAIVGWIEVCDPVEGEGSDAKHVLFPTENPDVDVCRSLLRAATAYAGAAGLRWATDNGPAHRQVAAELDAVAEELGDHIWQAPRCDWPAPAALTGLPDSASVRELADRPTGEELAQYARLYTAAGESRCDDDGCTTAWDPGAIAEMLSDRDPGQHIFLLDGPAGIRAEATADVLGECAVIWLVHHEAAAGELAAVVAAALDGVRARYPEVQSARAYVPPEAGDVVSAGLTTAGFTEIARQVIYRL